MASRETRKDFKPDAEDYGDGECKKDDRFCVGKSFASAACKNRSKNDPAVVADECGEGKEGCAERRKDEGECDHCGKDGGRCPHGNEQVARGRQSADAVGQIGKQGEDQGGENPRSIGFDGCFDARGNESHWLFGSFLR